MRPAISVPNLTWDIDVSGIQRIADNIKVMINNHIEYGILNNETYPSSDPRHRSGDSVAQIAAMHELGLDGMPARPFFIQSVKKLGKKEAALMSKHLFTSAFMRKIHDEDLFIVATALADTVRANIDEQNFTPLSATTVNKKGNSGILRDTDVLYDSITGKVVKGRVIDANS